MNSFEEFLESNGISMDSFLARCDTEGNNIATTINSLRNTTYLNIYVFCNANKIQPERLISILINWRSFQLPKNTYVQLAREWNAYYDIFSHANMTFYKRPFMDIFNSSELSFFIQDDCRVNSMIDYRKI